VTLEPSTIAILTGATRAVTYAASTLIVGVAVFDAGVLRQASLRAADRDVARARARTIGVLAAIVLLAAYAARLYIQVIDSYLVAVPTMLMIQQLIFLTRAWGHGLLGQLIISAALILSFVLLRRGSMPSALLWIVAPLAALSVPLTGHAASHGGATALAVQATHVFAVGSWLGTLAVVWVVCRAIQTAELVSIIRAFSPIALVSAATIAIAGALAFVIHVGTPKDLVTTSYGGVLIVKIALFAGAAGVGYVNWRRVTPDLASGGPRSQFTRTAALELTLGVMAILATALLTSLPQPGE
jgi:putative copper resistance protein D